MPANTGTSEDLADNRTFTNRRSMVKQYQRKRTKEELISGFKLAIAKKKEWLEAHHLEELKMTEA